MFQQLLNNPMQFTRGAEYGGIQMPNNAFRQKFEEFARNFQQSGQNPQQVVQNLLNSGKMTQNQFNQFRDIANKITGQRF